MNAAKNSAAGGELSRLARAADTHSWSLTVIPSPSAVMATKESGRLGEPWVVMAARGGRGRRGGGGALRQPARNGAPAAHHPRGPGRGDRRLTLRG
jgi:hypothetical protein